MVFRVAHWVINAANFAAAAGLLFLVFLTPIDALMRYVLTKPIVWSLDVTRFFVLVTLYLSMAYTLSQKSHIRVDLFTSRLSPRVRTALDAITNTAALAVFGLLIWKSFGFVQLTYNRSETTAGGMPLPIWPGILLVPVGSFLLGVQLVIEIYQDVKELRSGSPEPRGGERTTSSE